MIKLHATHDAVKDKAIPHWVRTAAAQREYASDIAFKKVDEKAKAVKKATGKWPHQSLMAVAGLMYLEQALGHSIKVMMIGTDGYFEMARIMEADDIDQGSFDMSIDGYLFTLYHNPDLPPFATAIPLLDC